MSKQQTEDLRNELMSKIQEMPDERLEQVHAFILSFEASPKGNRASRFAHAWNDMEAEELEDLMYLLSERRKGSQA